MDRKRDIEILDVAEVAELLKLDPQTVSRKAQRGEIPAFKLGNRWRFKLADLEKWIDGEKDTIQIRKFCEKQGDIKLAYLFGSRSTGKTTQDSDTDIAILLKDETPANIEIKAGLSSELISLLHTNKIDVVLLNNTTPLMRYEIIKDGHLLFAAPDFDVLQYKLDSIREYHDTEHIRSIRYSYFLEAVNF